MLTYNHSASMNKYYHSLPLQLSPYIITNVSLLLITNVLSQTPSDPALSMHSIRPMQSFVAYPDEHWASLHSKLANKSINPWWVLTRNHVSYQFHDYIHTSINLWQMSNSGPTTLWYHNMKWLLPFYKFDIPLFKPPWCFAQKSP